MDHEADIWTVYNPSARKAAPAFLISRDEATAIAARQIATIKPEWPAVCAQAALTTVDRDLFWRRQFLNPYAFEGAPEELRGLMG
jgi:serine/threonine-protein kinase HipA